MKVLVIILVLVVLALSFLQSLTRMEIARLRSRETAIDAALEILQQKVADNQLTLQSGCLDIHKLEKHLDGQIKANADVFGRVNSRIDELDERVAKTVKPAAKKPSKKADGEGAQQ